MNKLVQIVATVALLCFSGCALDVSPENHFRARSLAFTTDNETASAPAKVDTIRPSPPLPAATSVAISPELGGSTAEQALERFDGTRHALVIGNGAYSLAPLRNPSNDANDVAAKLATLGYDVSMRINADLDAMLGALKTFRRKLGSGKMGLFYYAGHGTQYQGESYLIPIGADIKQPADYPVEALLAKEVMRQMKSSGARASVIVLDACRDNPFISANRGGRGLGRIDGHGVGALIMFATSPNAVAADGLGRNSPFTSEFLRELEHTDRSVLSFFNALTTSVSNATDGQQIPWMTASGIPEIALADISTP